MLDYTIVVPSRKRQHNMATITRLLPTALICVDEREIEDYRPHVAASRLLPHPPMDGLFAVINWMMDTVKSPALIEIDDDFRGVQVLTGSRRFITDPIEILAILENALITCDDLGLTTFCFSRTANYTIVRPNEKPMVPSGPVCNAFGVLGAARKRHYDTRFLGRGDVDWTCQTLLEDRAVLQDVRYYFDCGNVFGGRGGNVGLVTPEQFALTSRRLKAKWGKHVSFKGLNFEKNKARDVAAIKIAVSRTNKTAQK